ncbi:MAG: OmpA family protein [Chitinophagales bacterium]
MNKLYALILNGFLLITTVAVAQNRDNPWLIALGTHGPQMTIGDRPFFKEYFNAKNWNLTPAAAHIKVYRHLKAGLSVGTTLSLGSAYRTQGETGNGAFFLDWDVDVKYSFANGYILKEKCWFDPYLVFGGGLNKWHDVKGSIDFGAGLNLWVVRNFGFFIEAKYNYLPKKAVSPVYNDPRPSYMHHSFGIVARFGKGRDTDKDGVPDIDDKCPIDPGKKELGGCPDTDGDLIIDKDDKCPLLAGLAQYGGCPDSDGDGIIDPNDSCPTVKGTPEMNGCPDSDGDGIADKDDACPDQKGLAELKGCPDRDGDGIADKEDACPDQKGLAINAGCPDSDGDGIPDPNDRCPNIFGVAENNGCPKPALNETQRVEVQKKLNFAAKNIFFETGKDILKKESYDDLDNVVAIMNEYNFLKLNIDGHTDNVGKEQSNVDLSNRRASAVMNYISSKGINPARMVASGYGPYRPVGDNKTAAGRAKNRRVEIGIKE